jgi:hypothetical protein
MCQFLVSSLLLLLATTSLAAQKARSLDLGITGGAARDYYRFAFRQRLGPYLGIRADAQVARTRYGAIGVTAQFDTYRYNTAGSVGLCATCGGDIDRFFDSNVRRVSAGPFWRHPIGQRFDVSGTVLGGWAKRTYPNAGELRGYMEDESSHLFYSAELGAGVHVRGFRVGAQWESGFMQRVQTGYRDNCITADRADPIPGASFDCRPIYGPRSFTRFGLLASYRIVGRQASDNRVIH